MKNTKSFLSPVVIISILGLSFLIGCQGRSSNASARTTNLADYQNYAQATFAGGCFWCSESDFENTLGVVEAVSGYTGGSRPNPTYEEVASGMTQHREAVRVFYDSQKVSYEQLLAVFWRHIDPTDNGGQFSDRGREYSSAIFYHDDEQERLAQKSKKMLAESGKYDNPVITPILPVAEFYVAEDAHQNYAKRNSLRYRFYRYGSGRTSYIEKTWGNELELAQKHSLTDKSLSATKQD